MEEGVRLWPNPASEGRVILSYRLPKPWSHARMKLYTTAARVVKSIALGDLAVGEGRLVVDLRDDAGKPLANGIYYFVLFTDAGRYGAKLLVLR